MRLSIPRDVPSGGRGPSVAALCGWFVGAELLLRLCDQLFPPTRLVTGALSVVLLVALTLVIAYWRDDDLPSAGVLLALLMGLAALLTGLLRELWIHPSIWIVVTGIPTVAFALLLRTIVGGIVAMAAIWFLRFLRRTPKPRSA